MSIETLVALRDASIKQTKDLNEMIAQMTKKIIIHYSGDRNERINTCYADRYPADITLATKYAADEFYVLFAILGGKNDRFDAFINDPTGKDVCMHAYVLKMIKELYQITTCDIEKKRLLAIAEKTHVHFEVLLNIYNKPDSEYIITDSELNDLFIFMEPSTVLKDLHESIMATIAVVRWNRKYGICDLDTTRLLYKFVREWLNTDFRKIFVSIE